MVDLSILIPSRQEMFLKRTIEDILENSEGNTEIITVLDGVWAEPQIVDHPKVILVHYSESIGQRAATNVAARISQAKFLMKVDAHCAFDKGFDVKMMAEMHDDWTMAPTMRNLHAFDWVCKKCGDRRYQGITPTSCPKCDNTTDFERDVVWIAKTNPQSNSYCFDSEPHFQYFGEYNKRPEGKGDITESMSLQGSCFMMTRDKYFELGMNDENFGSWGSQGIEASFLTWASGGRVVINHKTFYAHLFRTQGGDFSFPYHLSNHQVSNAKKCAKELIYRKDLPNQVHDLLWLLEKFYPVPGWSDEDLKKLKENAN
jgi:glycosyltransferase involved in cell wall biosynthesis